MFDSDSLEPAHEGEVQTEMFQDNEIRRELNDGQWFFSITDAIRILAETDSPSSYWSKVKANDPQLGHSWTKLKMTGIDGKSYPTECANIEEMFRIIQSIPSRNAEPFKRWLAKVGFERIQEHQNPELAMQRASVYYQLQGRDTEWIGHRLRSVVGRLALTDEWKKRGVERGADYAMLTSMIAKETFGITPKEHKEKKGIGSHTLRDHMSSTELVLTLLGETATKEIAESRDSFGVIQNKEAAQDGGAVAGAARRELEAKTGKSAISDKNFLTTLQKQNVLKRKGKGGKELPIPPKKAE